MKDSREIKNELMKDLLDVSPDMETIYIGIPAYCDKLLVSTMKNMLITAEHPERLHFGICYQDDDMDTLEELKKFDNCSVYHVPKAEAKGAGYAQHIVDTLYADEDYVFITESHIRCVKDWDTRMINMLNKCGTKAVLTNFCDGFKPDIHGADTVMPLRQGHYIKINRVMDTGHLANCSAQATTSNIGQIKINPTFNFGGKTAKIASITHMANSYMNDAESGYTIRIWTHGYDIYYCNEHCFFHRYEYPADTGVKNDISTRAFIDKKARSDRAYHRLSVLTGIETDDSIDFGEYGLGKERTLEAFEKFAGVDYKARKVTPSALRVIATPRPYVESENRMHYDARLKAFVSSVNDYKVDKKIVVGVYSYDATSVVTSIYNMIHTAIDPSRLQFVVCHRGNNKQIFKELELIKNCTVIVANDEHGVGSMMNMIENTIVDKFSHMDYFLMTEGRVRCSFGWDCAAVKMYDRYEGKHVVTAWLDYVPDGIKSEDYCVNVPITKSEMIRGWNVCDEGHIDLTKVGYVRDYKDENNYVCSCMSPYYFGEMDCIKDVKHNPNMESYHNETDYGIRLFTYGYDIRCAEYLYFHFYPNKSCGRMSSDDAFTLSGEYLQNLLQLKSDSSIDIGEYGLGHVKTLSEYEHKFKVSFAERSMEM